MMKHKKPTSKWMSVLSAVIALVMLSTMVFASGALSDLTTDDYTIEILNNGEKIELANKPFIENGGVYVPLRETLEKAGVMNHPQSYINWDNGKITISINEPSKSVNGHSEFAYQIEIGQKIRKVLSNPEPVNFDVFIVPPVLKDSNTYVQLGSVSSVLNEIYGTKLYKLEYNIFDKNGNDITVSVIDALERNKESVEMTDPIRTAELFFKAFYQQDFEKMKRYCTPNCVNQFFENSSVYGMKSVSLRSLAASNHDLNGGEKCSFEVSAYRIAFQSASAFSENRNETSFHMILDRQPNGIYLIDAFTN